MALGYGRKLVGKAGKNVGVNVFPLTTMGRGLRSFSVGNVTLAKTGRREALALIDAMLATRPHAAPVPLADLA